MAASGSLVVVYPALPVLRFLIPLLLLAATFPGCAMAKPSAIDAEAARIAAELEAEEAAAPMPALFLPPDYASTVKGGDKADDNGKGDDRGKPCPIRSERCELVGAPGPLPLLGLGVMLQVSRMIRCRITAR